MTATGYRPDLEVVDHPFDGDPVIMNELEILAERPASGTPERTRSGARRAALAVVVWFVVGFAIWCLLLSALPYQRHQSGLDRTLRAQLSQGLTPVNQPIAPGSPVARVRVPAIGLSATVVEGSEARQLVAGPGHLRTSVLPGQAGVSVLLGRAVTHGAPFRNLQDLERGDRIRVTNGQGDWTYRVASIRTYEADDARAFVATGNTLLLVSAEHTVFGPGRVVVRASGVGDLAQPGTRSNLGPATASELGLQGDASAATGVLVWLQVLVAACVGAVVLHRRWGRWPTWLLAAPVLASALWALYEYLALLLPAAY